MLKKVLSALRIPAVGRAAFRQMPGIGLLLALGLLAFDVQVGGVDPPPALADDSGRLREPVQRVSDEGEQFRLSLSLRGCGGSFGK